MTDAAYDQCVGWRQGGGHFSSGPRRQQYGRAHRDSYKEYEQYKTVTKINTRTGMPYLEEVPYTVKRAEPSYGSLSQWTPSDLYSGASTLPVAITNAFGEKRRGVKVVKDDPYSDKKQVTIFDEHSGASNTLDLKDEEEVVHIQEVDDHQNFYDDGYGGVVGDYMVPDKQIVTVKNHRTGKENDVVIDLDPGYDEAAA